MQKLIIRWLINTLAMYATVYLMNGHGITPQDENWLSFIWLALIFGLINAVLRPILVVAGCPFIILSLGVGMLLINTLLFYLAGVIGMNFGVGFTVDNFWAAFLGSVIMSVFAFILGLIFKDDKKPVRAH